MSKKIDRTGETTTNMRSQRCRIIVYNNNKDISVEIVDFKHNRFIVIEHCRYSNFVRGKIYFDACKRGEPYINAQREPHVPTIKESKIVAPAFEDADEAQGKAIGLTLMLLLIVFFTLIAAAVISFL